MILQLAEGVATSVAGKQALQGCCLFCQREVVVSKIKYLSRHVTQCNRQLATTAIMAHLELALAVK